MEVRESEVGESERCASTNDNTSAPDKHKASMEEYVKQCDKAMQTGK